MVLSCLSETVEMVRYPRWQSNLLVTHMVSGQLSAGTNTATLSSTSGLSSGDYVLIINMHGGSAGDYDLLAVDSVNGAALTFRSYLQYDYPSSDTVMAVRVPQYSSVSLSGQLFR